MTYRLEISETAQKQMRRVPENMLRLITQRISALKDNPRPQGAKKLVAKPGWRIRVGDYRVIYLIDDDRLLVNVAAVKPRQSAYD